MTVQWVSLPGRPANRGDSRYHAPGCLATGRVRCVGVRCSALDVVAGPAVRMPLGTIGGWVRSRGAHAESDPQAADQAAESGA